MRLIISLMICFARLLLAAQDTTAPILHNVSVSPIILNSGDSITVTIEITDDISGIKGVGFPNGGPFGTSAYLQHSNHTHWIPFSEWIHISGDRYKSTVFIPIEVSGGTWEVGGVHAIDLAGNEKYYRDSIDFTARFTVNSSFVVTDTTPPQLISISLLSDTLIIPGYLSFKLQIIENESGFSNFSVICMSNVSCPKINGNSSWQLDSVNTYISNEYWGPYSMGGLWTVDSIVLLDNALNKKTVYKGIDFNISFFVVDDIPDCFPPEFFSVSLSPTVVHRGDEISFSLEMRDTIAGLRLNACEINVANSYNQQRYSVNNFFRFFNSDIYLGSTVVSEYAANGLWKINTIKLLDFAINSITYLDWQLINNHSISYEVIPDSLRIIEGRVLTSDSLPLKNSRVFMIKQNSVDSSIYVMRLAFTDTLGYYRFESEKRDSLVYFKAIPEINLYPNQLPTYLDTTILFANAKMVSVNSILSTVDTIYTLQGVNEGGFGFISGYLSDGAGKRSRSAMANIDLILANISGEPVNGTRTNNNGYFVLQNIPVGNYIIYPAVRNPDFSKAPIFNINDTSSYLSLDFVFLNDHIALETNSVESIELNYLKVYPNPTNNKLLVEHRNIKPSNIELYDILGKRIEINVTSQIEKEILDLANVREGIYLLKASMKSGDSKVFRILVE